MGVKIESIEEVANLLKGLKRREVYKTKVQFTCEKCGLEAEVSLRQFKERGKEKLICQKCETKEKNSQKYGVDNIFKTKEFIESNKRNNLKEEKILKICKNYNLKLLESYTGVHENKSWKYYKVKCEKCGYVFSTYFFCKAKNSCPICCPKTISRGENELKDFVKSIYTGTISQNDRKVLNGKELDIYLPDLKIAFEYDGSYWHNNVNNYFKFESCKKQGIRLIHIIENTWEQKKEIVKSVIGSALGIQPKKFFARKCEIKEIDNKTYKTFCEENHLQGYAIASVRIGLFYENELVQIMSFSKTCSDEFEIVRECSKSYCGVVGGKQKLLKYFERKYKPKSIIGYCWKDYFTGNSFLNTGFTLTEETEPGCFYAKSSLGDLLIDAKDNNYLKIFHYGNYVFKKNNPAQKNGV